MNNAYDGKRRNNGICSSRIFADLPTGYHLSHKRHPDFYFGEISRKVMEPSSLHQGLSEITFKPN
jgi:hypothetical protein